MMTVFWNCEGLLLCKFLPPKSTINHYKYCKTIEKLYAGIKPKRPGGLTTGVRRYMMEHDFTLCPDSSLVAKSDVGSSAASTI
jgi:hypothetical protein